MRTQSKKNPSDSNTAAVLGKFLGITIDPVSKFVNKRVAEYSKRERSRIIGGINNLRYSTAIHSKHRHLKFVGE